MALPNFVCVGAQRAGTTSLYFLLQQHPDVFVPPHWKEPHFFDNPFNYGKGLAHYELDNFLDHTNERAIGDLTPSYMIEESVPERLYRDLGSDLKLIVCLRNPADRAYSQYLLNRSRLWENESFETALAREAERMTAGPFEYQRYSYVTRGLYHRHMTRFLEHFSRDQMMVLIYEEDFGARMPETLSRLFAFLDVAPHNVDSGVHVNRGQLTDLHRFAEATRFTLTDQQTGRPLRDVSLPAGGLLLNTPGKGAKMVYRPSPTLNRFLDRWSATRPDATKLSSEARRALIEETFLSDIKALEELLERDLSLWYDNANRDRKTT